MPRARDRRQRRWRIESETRRVDRCDVHGCVVVMRATSDGWVWLYGCVGCMSEVEHALVHGFNNGRVK